jgi:hypothetical protein
MGAAATAVRGLLATKWLLSRSNARATAQYSPQARRAESALEPEGECASRPYGGGIGIALNLRLPA